MNPCPCGWADDPSGRCLCNDEQIRRYRARISGPLLERIDLHVEVPRLPPTALRHDAAAGEASAQVRERVLQARDRQLARCAATNARMDQAQTDAHCRLAARDGSPAGTCGGCVAAVGALAAPDPAGGAYHRRPGRRGHRNAPHLTEAIGYRKLERGRERVAA